MLPVTIKLPIGCSAGMCLEPALYSSYITSILMSNSIMHLLSSVAANKNTSPGFGFIDGILEHMLLDLVDLRNCQFLLV